MISYIRQPILFLYPIFCSCVPTQWSGFSFPELQNFTLMLQREEELHIKELQDKFTTWKRILMDVMQEKCMEEAEKAEKKRGEFELRLQTAP
jgi:hypothetical protein